jgi:hypothetical protein
MTNWHSWQNLVVSPVAELSIPPADSNKGHEIWPPTNLWYLVAALLLQWAPKEACKILVETSAALKKAVSHGLDSLPEEPKISLLDGMVVFVSYAAATCTGTGLASSVMPYEDITDCVGSHGNQVGGTNP